jgi:hypothetical protein
MSSKAKAGDSSPSTDSPATATTEAVPEKAAGTVSAKNKRPKLVNKISTKTVWGKVEKDPKEAYPLFRVIGRSHGIKTGSTNLGEYTAFLGQFEATNAKTGEKFQSGKCFLPNVVTDILVQGMRSVQTVDDNASVEFVLDVGIAPDTSGQPNAYGYVYTVQQVVDVSASDPLAALRNVVKEAPQIGYDA